MRKRNRPREHRRKGYRRKNGTQVKGTIVNPGVIGAQCREKSAAKLEKTSYIDISDISIKKITEKDLKSVDKDSLIIYSREQGYGEWDDKEQRYKDWEDLERLTKAQIIKILKEFGKKVRNKNKELVYEVDDWRHGSKERFLTYESAKKYAKKWDLDKISIEELVVWV